jgi:hypothetical protein
MKAGRCFLETVAVLVLFSAVREAGLLEGPVRYVWVQMGLLVVVLALVAWTAGATPADLGLGRTHAGAGLRYGAGAVGIVLLVLVLAAVIPATNGYLRRLTQFGVTLGINNPGGPAPGHSVSGAPSASAASGNSRFLPRPDREGRVCGSWSIRPATAWPTPSPISEPTTTSPG